MAKFRFETEVETTTLLEYFIEAETLEEALEALQTGEVRGEGNILWRNEHWETEVITVEEELLSKEEMEMRFWKHTNNVLGNKKP
jgi:hypothetical protein